MPSNADLAKEANSLAEQLGIEVETDGLKNSDLVDLVSDLRAKVKDAENETQADLTPEAGAGAEAEAEAKPAYYVAKGKAITSKRGILDGDKADEVKAEYLAGGQEALDAFVKSGHILKG